MLLRLLLPNLPLHALSAADDKCDYTRNRRHGRWDGQDMNTTHCCEINTYLPKTRGG